MEKTWYTETYIWLLEAVARRYSIKKMFLKFLPNSQESTCVGILFLIKLQAYNTRFLAFEPVGRSFEGLREN